MRKYVKIVIYTVTAALLSSCGLAVLDNAKDPEQSDLTIVVAGSVSDIKTNTPLNGIRITLKTYPLDSRSKAAATIAVYSDSNGIYTIESTGYSEAVRCVITADSPDMEALPYESASQEININWTGTSFDSKTGTFFANDCDFKLNKVK